MIATAFEKLRPDIIFGPASAPVKNVNTR